MHKYLYVHGDPIMMSDPTGMFALGGMVASIGIALGNVMTELVTGALIITTLETGGRAGFGAQQAGLVLIAQGEFTLGFALHAIGTIIVELTLAVIDVVDTAISLAAVGVAVTFAAFALYKFAPHIADVVLAFGRRIRSRAARTSASVGGQLVGETTRMSFYHKGLLDDGPVVGQVSATRELSTGADRASVEALNRPGIVYEFQVPEGVLRQWEYEGKVRTMRDYDQATGTYNYEYRFSPAVSTEMNGYKVST